MVPWWDLALGQAEAQRGRAEGKASFAAKVICLTPKTFAFMCAHLCTGKMAPNLQLIPVVNILYDAILDTAPPSYDLLRESLNSMGLLSALLLTVAGAMPMSLDYDELDAVRARFNCSDPASIYPSCTDFALLWNGKYLITRLSAGCTNAFILLASSLCTTILLLILATVTIDIEVASTHPEKYLAWWRWMRWVFLWQFVTLTAGAVYTFNVSGHFFMIKFPDFYVEETGADSFDELTLAPHTDSQWGYYGWMLMCLIQYPVIIVLVINGFSLRAMHKTETPSTPRLTKEGAEGDPNDEKEGTEKASHETTEVDKLLAALRQVLLSSSAV